MVHEGGALFHVARFRDDVEDVAEQVESLQLAHSGEWDKWKLDFGQTC